MHAMRAGALFSALWLTACGGDASGLDGVTLHGQVTDGPIASANVCLYLDGQKIDGVCAISNVSGAYALAIPGGLSGFATLVAEKPGGIKLASVAGPLEDIFAEPGDVPAATITHFTTAVFALADQDADGRVLAAEYAAALQAASEQAQGQAANEFARLSEQMRQAVAMIKAAIDGDDDVEGGGQTALLAGGTPDTLSLAQAILRKQPVGANGITVAAWFEDEANAPIILRALEQALDAPVNDPFAPYFVPSLAPYFASYTYAQSASSVSIEGDLHSPIISASKIMQCNPDLGEADRLAKGTYSTNFADIILNAGSGRVDFIYLNRDYTRVSLTGAYDPSSGSISVNEYSPLKVIQTDGYVTHSAIEEKTWAGKVDAAGNVSGTFTERFTLFWNLDASSSVCNTAGTFVMSKP